MKKIYILLALLCLCGCSAKTTEKNQSTPPAPSETVQTQPQPQSGERDLFLFENGSRSLAIDEQGNVVLEIYDGEMSIPRTDTKAAGICVMRTEGVITDDWGWKQPERYRNDVYDVNGNYRYTLPLRYVNLFGNIAMGYNQETNTSQIYRWSDGTLLYDNVCAHYVLGDRHFINQHEWEAPGIFLDADGKELAVMPEQYIQNGRAGKHYMVVAQDGLYGLMNTEGELVLPCQYLAVENDSLDHVLAQTESEWQVIEPQSGEVLFRWPYPIEIWTGKAAIVQTSEQYGQYKLVDAQGNPLMEEALSWPSHYDPGKDSVNYLFHAAVYENGPNLLFTEDGTIIHSFEGNGYISVLDEDTVLEVDYYNDGADWFLADPEQGTRLQLEGSTDTYYYRLYDIQGVCEGYLCRTGLNEQGWHRMAILDYEGNVLLDELQSVVNRGDGLFQCTRGFTSGLLRLDGTWLYQESAFSGLDND